MPQIQVLQEAESVRELSLVKLDVGMSAGAAYLAAAAAGHRLPRDYAENIHVFYHFKKWLIDGIETKFQTWFLRYLIDILPYLVNSVNFDMIILVAIQWLSTRLIKTFPYIPYVPIPAAT